MFLWEESFFMQQCIQVHATGDDLVGSSFTCGCLIRRRDPYNNASKVKDIEVMMGLTIDF